MEDISQGASCKITSLKEAETPNLAKVLFGLAYFRIFYLIKG
jgi:hypothetical protein